MSEIEGLTDEEMQEAEQLLGDRIAGVMDKTGIATAIKKFLPNCGCAGRRARLNAFHRKIMGKDVES